jgi:hypothetical protein
LTQTLMRPLPEQWIPIADPRFVPYEVSDLGHVRRPGKRVLTPDLNERGYHTVRLNGIRATIHSLVLKAFRGPRPDGMVGRHLDDDKDNNGLSNLVWGTQSDNILDTVRSGTHRNVRKTECPIGHKLEAPNLRAGEGKRDCLACGRAQTYCAKHNIMDKHTEEANKYYDMIIRGLGHVDRRKWRLYV